MRLLALKDINKKLKLSLSKVKTLINLYIEDIHQDIQNSSKQ